MEIFKKAVIKQGITGSDPRWVANLMRDLIPFDSQGAMRARRFDGKHDFDGSLGRLEWTSGIFPLYMVWSYDTPIGWVGCTGRLHVPRQTYSSTTSHHQGLVSAFMGMGPCGHGDGLMHECAAWRAIEGDWV